MSYYAKGEGLITLKENFSNDELTDVSEILNKVGNVEYSIDEEVLDIFYDGKWDGDEFVSVLNELVPYIVSGVISFEGEDQELWRYLLKKDKWWEQGGQIVYTDFYCLT